jgi:hypothetical protein
MRTCSHAHSSDIKRVSGTVPPKPKYFIFTLIFCAPPFERNRVGQTNRGILAVVYIDTYVKANFNEIFVVFHDVYIG